MNNTSLVASTVEPTKASAKMAARVTGLQELRRLDNGLRESFANGQIETVACLLELRGELDAILRQLNTVPWEYDHRSDNSWAWVRDIP